MTTSPRARGSSLLAAVIVVLIVTAIAVGVINFAYREVAGAHAGAKEQALVACAETARQLLTSQFHALGVRPSEIQALNVPLDGPAGSARTFAVGGHMGTQGVRIAQVSPLPGSAFGPTDAIADISNSSGLQAMGGTPLKIVVHCRDGGSGATDGRQLEVEFGVRFGL
jgi:hypothetical protein